MHVVICDDDLTVAQQMHDMLAAYSISHDFELKRLDIYTDSTELLEEYKQNGAMDLLFLDIDMPKLTGMQLAEELRILGCEAMIVFVTNYAEFMASAFQVEAFDFLSKPVSTQMMNTVMNRCVQKYSRTHGVVELRTPEGLRMVPVNDILLLHSRLHHTFITMTDGSEIRVGEKLSQLAELLAPYRHFVRTHQSYMVNLHYVAELQRDAMLLKKQYVSIQAKVPVSRSYVPKVKQQYMQYYLV